MAERSIPFSPPMVRAVLAGTKTQTRRIVKWRPPGKALDPEFTDLEVTSYVSGLFTLEGRLRDGAWARRSAPTRCPYGQPGDRLWVREPWRVGKPHDHKPPREIWPRPDDKGVTVLYEAGGSRDMGGRYPDTDDEPVPPWAGKYRPAMFMLRAFSRITLEVTGVHVERLQAIRECDAFAEGCAGGHGAIPGYAYAATYTEHFRHLWESLNGAASWDANPWVWVIGFRRVMP